MHAACEGAAYEWEVAARTVDVGGHDCFSREVVVAESHGSDEGALAGRCSADVVEHSGTIDVIAEDKARHAEGSREKVGQ